MIRERSEPGSALRERAPRRGLPVLGAVAGGVVFFAKNLKLSEPAITGRAWLFLCQQLANDRQQLLSGEGFFQSLNGAETFCVRKEREHSLFPSP